MNNTANFNRAHAHAGFADLLCGANSVSLEAILRIMAVVRNLHNCYDEMS